MFGGACKNDEQGTAYAPGFHPETLGGRNRRPTAFYEKDWQIILAGVTPASLAAAQIAAEENHIYSLEEIRRIAVPLAREHQVQSLWLFGSYARQEATGESDLDFIIDRGAVCSLLQLGGFQASLADAFHKRVDVLPRDSLEEVFRESIRKEEVLLYDRAGEK